MCGFIAAFTKKKFSNEASRLAMESLYKRGPDDFGQWREKNVYLGHRRLAVIDIDKRSSQPLVSNCGRYIIVFNGEIYNYKELKKELINKGYKFKTESDTEVILTLFSIHGESMLSLLRGMFAFVIWDKKNKSAFAARDPYGIKPLYLGFTNDGIILCSQVKALLATKLISSEPNIFGRFGFFMLGTVPEPYSWFKKIQPLLPGHYVWIKNNNLLNSKCWFDISNVWNTAPNNLKINKEVVLEGVRKSIKESILKHMVSDVPVGILLSGGVDSSVLTKVISESNVQSVKAITIVFKEFENKSNDEGPFSSVIANHYNVDHHIRVVTKKEFLADLPIIFDCMDQPSIDGINIWYACKAAKEIGLKVVVSGVGADELFYGYTFYKYLPKFTYLWSKASNFYFLLNFIFNIFYLISKNGRWKYACNSLKSIRGAWWLKRSVSSPDDLYEFISENIAQKCLSNFIINKFVEEISGKLDGDNLIALSQIESKTYLRNQLLRDSDWASMSHGVELRTPFVDSKLLLKLKPYLRHFKFFPNKALLTQFLDIDIVKKLNERGKVGFETPIHDWRKESKKAYQTGYWHQWMKDIVSGYR